MPTKRSTRPGPVAIAAVCLVVSLLVAGCGSGGPSQDQSRAANDTLGEGAEWRAETRAALAEERPIEGVRDRGAGAGAEGAVVLWSESLPEPPRDVVVFLPSWGPLASLPELYGPWLSHLAAQGSTVVFPTYFPFDGDPGAAPGNALAGIAAGLESIEAEPTSIVAVGHTSGGALAFDYAAGAADAGLPRPDAILAIFPARNPGGIIPAIDPAGIAPRTRIVVVSGEANPVVEGEEQARAMLRTARRVPPERRRYVAVDTGAHPIDSDAVARRAYWRPLDRLLERVRGERRASD